MFQNNFSCEKIDMNEVINGDNNANLERAFAAAEQEFGITRLLDPEGRRYKYLNFSQ